MAHSIDYWYKLLVNGVNTSAKLKEVLTSKSKTSVWRSIYYTFATGLKTLEDLWDQVKETIDKKLSTQIVGTGPWYKEKTLEYSTGKDVKFTDEGKWEGGGTQPIKYCSVVDLSNSNPYTGGVADIERRVEVKVLKDAYAKFTSDEIKPIQQYLDKIKFVGTNIVVQSNDIDKIKISVKIYKTIPYDAESDITEEVKKAANRYKDSLEFNGRFVHQELMNGIEGAKGVSIAEFVSLEYKNADGIYIKNDMPWLFSLSGAFEYETIDVSYG